MLPGINIYHLGQVKVAVIKNTKVAVHRHEMPVDRKWQIVAINKRFYRAVY